MLARKRCRSVAAHSSILGLVLDVITRRHPQIGCCLRSARVSGSYITRRNTPNDSTPCPSGVGFRYGFEDFSLPSSYINRCYRRVVSCLDVVCFPFRWLGLDLDGFFPPVPARGNPETPPGVADSSARAITREPCGRLFQRYYERRLCSMAHIGDVLKISPSPSKWECFKSIISCRNL